MIYEGLLLMSRVLPVPKQPCLANTEVSQRLLRLPQPLELPC